MLLFINLFSGPVKSVALNAVESIRVIGCSLTLTFDHLKERAKLIMAPVVEVLTTSVKSDMGLIRSDLMEIQTMVLKIKDEAEFSRNHTDLMKISPTIQSHGHMNESEVLNDIQQRLQIDQTKSQEILNKTKELFHSSKLEIDGDKLALKASIDTKTLQQLMKANMSGSIEEFDLTKIIYESCLGVFRGAKGQCDMAVEDLNKRCRETVGFLLAPLVCSPIHFTAHSVCPWLLDQVIDETSICNSMHTSMANRSVNPFNLTDGANINSVYKDMTEKLSSFNDDIMKEEEMIEGKSEEAPRRLELSISINDNTLKLLLKTRDLWRYITDKYRWRRAFYDLLMFLYEVYTTITFLCIFMQAINYQRSYLKNIKFDNKYITGMFKNLDRRRRLVRKESVLPLTKVESERFITTFTCKRRTSEEKKSQRASCTIILLFLAFALSLLYIDDIFYSILSSIHEHALIKYRELGHHDLQVNVMGDGPLAQTVRRLAVHFNTTYDLNKSSTTSQCLPRPESTSTRLHLQFLYLVFAYIFIDQMSIYAMRLRRVTVAFFYTDKEQQRVAYLYNLILQSRRRLKRDGLSTLDRDDDNDDDGGGSPRDKEIFTIRDAIVYIKNCVRDGICCGTSRCFNRDSEKNVGRLSRLDKAKNLAPVVYKLLAANKR